MPSRLLDTLRALNSKERFFLVGYALGNSHFKLGEKFRADLEGVLSVPIPEDAYCAMDFHLDWLYAALQVTANGGSTAIYPNDDRFIKAQQENIDLLVGYQREDGCHIALVEAKAATGWTNGQMKSKAARLVDIFGEDGKKWAGVTPHFVLMSPKKPLRLNISDWPRWMTPHDEPLWMRLDVPKQLKRVSRCKPDGTPWAHGECWTVLDR